MSTPHPLPLSATRLLWLATLLCAGVTSCSTSSTLYAQADEIAALNGAMEQRAIRCAPQEYALATSHREFGAYELGQGNFSRAGQHLLLAEKNAKVADALSDFPECRDTKVALVLKKEPVVTPTDRDGDGLVDASDRCPDDPEDVDGYQDEDGCPEPDNDADTILDESDRCPDVAEDRDGYQDEDGCPDLDNDTDGLADINDSCRDQAEDFDGYQDEDGCPDLDNDADSIADVLDECPSEAEDYDNDEDEDGCPEEAKLVQIEGDRIKLNESVFFKTAKATILPVSFPLLDEVAKVLRENPTLQISVEGHTDSRGGARYNKDLSTSRAASVVQYLVGQGIGPQRMVSAGFGEAQPIEDNATEAGRASNRRVEIRITGR